MEDEVGGFASPSFSPIFDWGSERRSLLLTPLGEEKERQGSFLLCTALPLFCSASVSPCFCVAKTEPNQRLGDQRMGKPVGAEGIKRTQSLIGAFFAKQKRGKAGKDGGRLLLTPLGEEKKGKEEKMEKTKGKAKKTQTKHNL